MKRGLTMVVLALVAATVPLQAGEPFAPWRGPERDGKWPDKGLLKTWPADGPQLLWTADGCGLGFANVAIADGLITTAGTFDGQTFVLAFDLDGKQRWKSPNGPKWTTRPKNAKWAGTRYDGARAAPTIDDGTVYHLNALGRLAAYDAKTGAERWSLPVTRTFDATVPTWGYSEHVLVDDDRLICYPGGKKGYMVALDRKTGRTRWANTDIGDPAGNGTAIFIAHGNVRQVVTMTTVSVVGVDANTGKLLWRRERDNRYRVNCETPLVYDGSVYVSSGYKFGSDLIKLNVVDGETSARVLWSNPKADALHCGPILHEGFIYGVGYSTRRWFCLDVQTGKLRYRDTTIRRGSLAFADGMIYCLGARGTMWLIAPSPNGLKIVSQFKVPRKSQGFMFAHPVIAGGRLYLRHRDQLFAYDLRATGD